MSPPQARVLVAPGGEEQEPRFVLLAHPVPDREGLARIGQELEGAQVRGQHGPDREGGLGVLGVHDGLGHRALHGLGQGRQVGLEQVVDQHPVLGDPLLPEHARAVCEQLPRGRDPEGVHRVLLLGDEGGGHHVEVPGRPGLVEGGPAGRPGIEGVHQHVPGGIEEGAGIAPHLVVEDAALAPGAEPGDEVGDQDGLARSGGAGDDGVLGLGALRARGSRRCGRRPGAPAGNRASARRSERGCTRLLSSRAVAISAPRTRLARSRRLPRMENRTVKRTMPPTPIQRPSHALA